MAITVQDVQTSLQPIIVPSPYIDGEKMIQLSDSSGVHVNTFVSMFGSAASMSAADLREVDTANNYGYSVYIDEWQMEGFIV